VRLFNLISDRRDLGGRGAKWDAPSAPAAPAFGVFYWLEVMDLDLFLDLFFGFLFLGLVFHVV